jgi:diadenosine tetraphosphate (Ap4A) HIT family hydrolase
MQTRDFLGNDWDIDCMGCAIGNRSMFVPGDFILKTQHFCVHQDPLIPLPGFLVITSLRHIQSISEMQESEYTEFSGLIRPVHDAIKETTKIEYLTIIQEESSIHFHLWFFPWTHAVLECYREPSLTKIRDIMASYRRQSLDVAEWQELEKSIGKIKTLLTQKLAAN